MLAQFDSELISFCFGRRIRIRIRLLRVSLKYLNCLGTVLGQVRNAEVDSVFGLLIQVDKKRKTCWALHVEGNTEVSLVLLR